MRQRIRVLLSTILSTAILPSGARVLPNPSGRILASSACYSNHLKLSIREYWSFIFRPTKIYTHPSSKGRCREPHRTIQGLFCIMINYLMVNKSHFELPQSIIYTGFAVWSLGCGLLSTVNEGTKKALPVLYMLISGVGAGQVRQFLPSML